MLLTHNLSYVATAQSTSPVRRTFRSETTNRRQQLARIYYMYCLHARKRASGAPRAHFKPCKISKFPRGVPPDPPHTIQFVGPHFLYLPCPPPPPPPPPPNPLGGPVHSLQFFDPYYCYNADLCILPTSLSGNNTKTLPPLAKHFSCFANMCTDLLSCFTTHSLCRSTGISLSFPYFPFSHFSFSLIACSYF